MAVSPVRRNHAVVPVAELDRTTRTPERVAHDREEAPA
jgi:hypothetical protein